MTNSTYEIIDDNVAQQKNQNATSVTTKFHSVFTNEFSAFKKDAHSLAKGKVSFSNRLTDWLRFGLISTTSASVGATFGLLAALGVVSGFVTLGVGFGVSLAAIAAGVGYNIFLFSRGVRRNKRADQMMDVDNYDELVEQLSGAIADLYADRLKHCNNHEASMLATSCQEVISNAMLLGKVNRLDDLVKPGKLNMLLTAASLNDSALSFTAPAIKQVSSTGNIIKLTKAHIADKKINIEKQSNVVDVKDVVKNESRSRFSTMMNWIQNTVFGRKKAVNMIQSSLPNESYSTKKLA